MRSVFGVSCNQCPHKVVRGTPRSAAMVTPYREGPIYKLACPAGHSTLVLLTNPKHEIVFQMAAYALYDGNYRGAISDFTSSLECFWYFTIQCIAASQGARPLPLARTHITKNDFAEEWGTKFQSDPVPVLSEPEYALRNRVLHQGLIPSEDQAFAYGDRVMDLIVPAMMLLRQQQGAVAEASSAILEREKTRQRIGAPTAAILDAMILHDNESLRYRRLREDYMPQLKKLDELFELLSRNGQYYVSEVT